MQLNRTDDDRAAKNAPVRCAARRRADVTTRGSGRVPTTVSRADRRRGARLAPIILRADDGPVEIPDARYARADDVAYIAYQTLGEGPIDLIDLATENIVQAVRRSSAAPYPGRHFAGPQGSIGGAGPQSAPPSNARGVSVSRTRSDPSAAAV
jgi:hypothetical protein